MRVDQGNVYHQLMERFNMGRDLVPFKEPQPPALVNDSIPVAAEEAKAEPKDVYVPILNVRNASPREISELGLDFYAAGILVWREYEMLAFQPELQPGFNNTIGALTGEKADPGRRRDFVAIWQDRLAFEKKYNPGDKDLIERTQRIADALKRIESPTNLVI